MRIILGLILFCAFCAPPQLVADDYIPPETIEVVTPVYKPEFAEFEPALGTYTYTVSWQGIPAATISLGVEQDQMFYHVSTAVQTYSGIDIFYKLRYKAQGTLSSEDLSPVKTIIDHQENSRIKNVSITFHENGDIEAVRTQKGSEPKVLRFNPKNLMLDPFGAAFLARSLHWEPGETKQFDTFNGKSRYLISLTCSEKIQMKVNDEMRDVWVITPKVTNLTSKKPSNKLRSAQIYVTADKARDILQIVSKVFVGSVTTKLVSFEPSAHVPATRMVRRGTDHIVR